MGENKLFEVDSEVAVLSILLKNPNLVHNLNGLRFYMFSSTPHQTLMEEVEEALEKQFLPDPTLIYASLESKSLVDKIGGRKYFEILLNKEVSEGSFDQLVKLVISSYKARSFLSITAGVNKSKLNPSNVEEEIYSMKKALETLIEVNGQKESQNISDLVVGAYEEIVARTKNPGIRGVTWGVESLDNATGGKSAGDVVIIAGRPGSGKTSAIMNSIIADGENGVPSLLIEREMRTQELMERLISVDTGISSTNIRLGMLNQEQIQKVYTSLGKLKKYPIFLETNYRASDPYYIESVVNKFRNKHGIQNVYLDYIQILTERDEGQTQEIGRLTRLFKILSNDLGICSILLSQLNRNVEFREDKRPMLSDMRQSGSIEEDADFVIGLYRDEYYNKESKYKGLMEYIVLKHRNGPTGTVTVKFDGPTYKISEAR
jgi:replicative DNA helicase